MRCIDDLDWFYNNVSAAFENSGVNVGEDIRQKLSDDEVRNLLDGIFSLYGEVPEE